MKSKNKVEKLVKCIAKKKFLKAHDVLDAIIREKIDERVTDVLASQEQKADSSPKR